MYFSTRSNSVGGVGWGNGCTPNYGTDSIVRVKELKPLSILNLVFLLFFLL